MAGSPAPPVARGNEHTGTTEPAPAHGPNLALWAAAGLGGVAALGSALLGVKYLPGRVHQVAFVLRNLHRPWLAPTARDVSRLARGRTAELFGPASHVDDAGDAFRHAFASGALKLRAMRDHGMGETAATRLVHDAGYAHELDGADNTSHLSMEMDLFNNAVGNGVVEARRDRVVPATDDLVAQRVLDAMRDGELRVFAPGGDRLRATTVADVPKQLERLASDALPRS